MKTTIAVCMMVGLTLVAVEAGAQPGVVPNLAAPKTALSKTLICGTEVTPEQVAFEKAYQKTGPRAFHRPAATPYYVPISFHIVRRSDGTGGLPPERLHDDLRDLNYQYQQVGIQFYRLWNGSDYAIHYVDNDSYYYGTYPHTGLRNQSPVSNTINVYYVPNLGQYAGYSSFPSGGEQGIMIVNSWAGIPDDTHLLAHEVGHYLNLYHTHETAFGVECPSGSNCAIAGDQLCDTPADPNLTDKVDATCVYTGSTAPPYGCTGTYNPQTNNLMAYSYYTCQNLFTPQQIDRMIDCLLNIRSGLVSEDVTDSDGDGVIDIIDNCPSVANSGQEDGDGDGIGDLCDVCPQDIRNDADGDGICGNVDNCPFVNNADQKDSDGNGVGDACRCSDGVMQVEGAHAADNLGWRVRGAGDVNNDGYNDIVVGANLSEGVSGGGGVYVYSGKDGALLYKVIGEMSGGQFGFSVSGAGDINHDGYDDFAAGEFPYTNNSNNPGRVYYFLGSGGPFPVTLRTSDAFRTITGQTSTKNLGVSLALIGDVNTDGYADLVVGAMENAGPGEAAIYSGLDGTKLLAVHGPVTGVSYGYAVASAGLVNGDNIPDFLVGSMAYNSYAGRVYLYSGSDGSLLRIFEGLPGAYGAGAIVAGGGDVNADGKPDILIGAPWGIGEVGVYDAASGALLNMLQAPAGYGMFGWGVDFAGDINGDGYDDIAVGAPYDAENADQYGTTFIFSGINGDLLYQVRGENFRDWFGRDICATSDFNNDGINDLAVAAFDYGSNGNTWSGKGKVYIYFVGDPDHDGLQAGCDDCTDTDHDGFGNPGYAANTCAVDNCPNVSNPTQADADHDGIGDACCCVGVRGNVNDVGIVDLADLSALVSYLTGGGYALPCPNEANVNGVGIVDLGDLSALVSYLTGGGYVLPSCGSAILPTPAVNNTSSVQLIGQFDGKSTTVSLSSSIPVRAIEVELKIESSVLPANLMAGSMDQYLGRDGNNTKVILVDTKGKTVLSGEVTLLRVPGRAEIISGSLADLDHSTVTPRILNADREASLPARFALRQNYPNPFNPTTTISFSLPTASDYRLTVYNLIGQVVKEFVGSSDAGEVSLIWDAHNTASGVYLYRLTAGEFTETRRMMLLK